MSSLISSFKADVKNNGTRSSPIYIGTAAWTLPAAFHDLFPKEGTHLRRYSCRLNAVEINSSFYKDHQAKTYARWAQSTPDHFRFSVKLSQQLTHIEKLSIEPEALFEKISSIRELGEKLAVLLIQLPPSLRYDHDIAERFLSELRKLISIPIVFEPRHLSWTSEEARSLFKTYNISKVLADPPVCNPAKPESFLSKDLVYYRLHGSPEVYRSPYDDSQLNQLESELRLHQKKYRPVWCIFDNTTFGYATLNAIQLTQKLKPVEKGKNHSLSIDGASLES